MENQYGLLSDQALDHILSNPMSKRFPAGIQAQALGRYFRNGWPSIKAWCDWFSALTEGAPGIWRNEWVVANEGKIDQVFKLYSEVFPD